VQRDKSLPNSPGGAEKKKGPKRTPLRRKRCRRSGKKKRNLLKRKGEGNRPVARADVHSRKKQVPPPLRTRARQASSIVFKGGGQLPEKMTTGGNHVGQRTGILRKRAPRKGGKSRLPRESVRKGRGKRSLQIFQTRKKRAKDREGKRRSQKEGAHRRGKRVKTTTSRWGKFLQERARGKPPAGKKLVLSKKKKTHAKKRAGIFAPLFDRAGTSHPPKKSESPILRGGKVN